MKLNGWLASRCWARRARCCLRSRCGTLFEPASPAGLDSVQRLAAGLRVRTRSCWPPAKTEGMEGREARQGMQGEGKEGRRKGQDREEREQSVLGGTRSKRALAKTAKRRAPGEIFSPAAGRAPIHGVTAWTCMGAHKRGDNQPTNILVTVLQALPIQRKPGGMSSQKLSIVMKSS